MKDLILRQNAELERTFGTGDYQDFRGLKFKIIDNLPLGQYVEFTTDEPTYIKQSTGEMKVTAKAPTIIEGHVNKITIDGYAPVWVRRSVGGIDAHLRDNSIIEEIIVGHVNINAAPYLGLMADCVRDFNGRYNQGGPVHFNAPEGNRGIIWFKGVSSNFSLNFKYDNQTELYSPKDSNSMNLVQRLRALFK